MSLNRRSNQDDVPPPGVQDRRGVCRYSVVQEGAWLGWWEGQTYQTTAAKIIDISLRGAFLTVDTLPPKDQPLYFCPPGVTPSDEWIEVKVVNARKKMFGAREVRVIFRKIFPYDIFKAVVYGPDSVRTIEPAAWVPENTEERDWW